jgi:hypothetical protein
MVSARAFAVKRSRRIAVSEGNVSGSPLSFILKFFGKGQNENAENAKYKQTRTSLTSFLPLLPTLSPTLQKKLAPLKSFLTTDLGTIFNQVWAGVQAKVESEAVSQFISLAAAAGEAVNTVTPTFPATGTLTASTFAGFAATPTLPAWPATLTLEFALPGCSFNFEHGSLTAYYNLNFDAALVIGTNVPALPFSLNPRMSFTISNADLQADSFWADIETFLDDVFTDIGNFFTQGDNYQSDWNLAQAAVTQRADGSFSVPPGQARFLTLLASINAAGPEFVALGFTECAFSVANGNTLTLTVTHPLDAGPEISDPNDPKFSLISPELSVSDPEVKPGQTVTCNGINFPVASVSQILLTWANTSSGSPTGAQLKYEVTGKKTATIISVPLSALSSGLYKHTVESLKAGTEYSFWARCGDALTWSKWSDTPFKIKTEPTTLVELVLKAAGDSSASGVVVGSANLSGTSTNWTATALIPATTAPGVYDLIAQFPGGGSVTAMITVANTLEPAFYIPDAATGAPTPSPAWLMVGSPFHAKGVNFPAGTASVFLDGALVGEYSAPSGEFTASLTAPETFSLHTVEATVGSASASFTFNLMAQPK